MLETFFIGTRQIPSNAMHGEYIPYLLFLSYVVASLGVFTGLTITNGMVRAKSGELKNLLHVAGAFALGSGIWSMHFIGMLAYRMKVPFGFDFKLTIVSMVVAVAFAAVALGFARVKDMRLFHVILCSIVLGMAISSMHYVGMAAIRMEASLRYTTGYFLISFLVAVLSSGVALSVIFYFGRVRNLYNAVFWRIIGSLILGLGVCGMHYVGMAAANFIPYAAMCRADDPEIVPNIDSNIMALAVTMVTSLILIFAVTTGIYNREQESLTSEHKRDIFPAKLIGASVLLTFVTILCLGGFNGSIARQMHILIAKDEKIGTLSLNYLEIDKKMQNALSIYAMTRDPHWGDVYFSEAYDQQRILNNLKEIMREDQYEKLNKFDETEERRSRVDREILSLAGSGLHEPAMRLERSIEYQTLKQRYEDELNELIRIANDRLHEDIRSLIDDDYIVLFLSLLAAIALAIIWYFSFRSFRRWQKEIIETRNSLHERVLEKEAMEKRMSVYLDEVKRARDRALQAMHEADHASEAKSEFLTKMSHELRTPMNSILGLTELLIKNDKTVPEHKELLTVILESGETLLKIVNDVLDIAKIEAEGLVLQNKSFAVKPMLTTIANSLKQMAFEKNLDLVLDFDHIETNIIGDEVRLARIFTNLLGNAIKYTDHGSVAVAVRILSEDGKHILRADIVDTGIGIAQDKLQVIFEKFSQADNSNTRKYGGTGLGLAITRELVDLMGGTVGVESVEGKGSKFWIKIPVEISQRSSDSDSTQKTPRPRPFEIEGRIALADAHILVAEDHPPNRVFMQTFFNEMGFQDVTMAEDGLQVLDILKREAIDVVLMDCHMPELNGYEATRQIRQGEIASGEHIPIVAMTAKAMVGDREECISAGMDDYISKPVDGKALKKILSRWIIMETA